MRRAAALLLLWTAAAAAPEDVALRFHDAWKAGDHAAMAAVASEAHADPVAVAERLLDRGIDPAVAFAEGAGLGALGETLRGLDPDREARRRALLRRLSESNGAGTWEESVSQWEEEDHAGPTEVSARFLLAEALRKLSRPEAVAAYGHAADLARAIGWTRAEAGAFLWAGSMSHFKLGKHRDALALLAKSLALHEALGDHGGVATTHDRMAKAHRALKEHRASLPHLEAGREHALAAGDARFAAALLLDLAATWMELGDREGALQLGARARDELLATGDRAAAAKAVANMAVCCRDLGRRQEACTHLEWSLEQFEALGEKAWAVRIANDLAVLLQDEGRYGRAWKLWERCIELEQEQGDAEAVARTLNSMAQIRRRQYRYAEALELKEMALRKWEELGDLAGVADLLKEKGDIHSEDLSDYAEAQRIYEQALRIRERVGGRTETAVLWAYLGYTVHKLGDYARARALLERARAGFEELGDAKGVAMASGNLVPVLTGMQEYAQALECSDVCLAIARSTGNPREEAVTLLNRAWVHRAEGDHGAARATLDRAFAVARQAGERHIAARVLFTLGFVADDLGHDAEAIRFSEDALREFEAMGNVRSALSARNNLGLALKNAGRFDEAEACHLRVVEIAEANGWTGTAAGARINLGVVREARGDFTGARKLYEEALRGIAPGSVGQGDALGNLANLDTREGRYASALTLHEDSAAIYAKTTEILKTTASLQNLAVISSRIGLYRRALAYHERTLELERKLGRTRAIRTVLRDIGHLHRMLGDHARALDLLEDLHREERAAGDGRGATRTLSEIGMIHLSRGDPATALRLFRRCREEREALQLGVANDFWNIGRAHLAAGEDAEAEDCLGRALAAKERRGEIADIASILVDRARLRIRRDAYGEASEDAQRSLRIRIRLAEGIDLGESGRLRVQARDAADLGLRATASLLAAERGDPAGLRRDLLYFVEAGRGLQLVEELVHRDALLSAALAPDLRDAHAAARMRLQRAETRLRSVASSASAEGLEEAALDLDHAYADLEAVVGRMHRRAGHAADLAYPRPVPLAELRAALPDDAALLLYAKALEEMYVLVVGRDGLSCVHLGEAAAIEQEVEAYLRLAAAPGMPDLDAARALHARLFEPLEHALAGRTRLLLAPDGALTFLPFEALHDGERRVIERFEVAYVPSGTAYAALRPAAGAKGRGVVALGDPAYPDGRTDAVVMRDAELRGLNALKRLPASGDEARAVADLFDDDARSLLLREEASVPGLMRALAGRRRLRALHLACHGFVDTEHPRLTGLVLAGGEVLGLDDIYRLQVDADLVVLSACKTARGRFVRGAGVVGLVRGFFFAGAPRVVVSNWEVSDASTRDLMVGFYRAMLKDGLRPASALRATKRAMLAAGGKRAHPYHWAGFVLWGLPD